MKTKKIIIPLLVVALLCGTLSTAMAQMMECASAASCGVVNHTKVMEDATEENYTKKCPYMLPSVGKCLMKYGGAKRVYWKCDTCGYQWFDDVIYTRITHTNPKCNGGVHFKMTALN